MNQGTVIRYKEFPPNYYPEHIYRNNEIENVLKLNSFNYKQQYQLKSSQYLFEYRTILADVLTLQYETIENNAKALSQIEKLRSNNAFTLTTGQQIHIALGPMYVHNKIISLSETANEVAFKNPQLEIIPVFWMATEDHDMAEIDWFDFGKTKHTWQHNYSGLSGKAPTTGIWELIEKAVKDKNIDSKKLELFKNAYTNYSNLADATRYLVNELYTELGILVIDGDNFKFKHLFKNIILNDIIHNTYEKCYHDNEEILTTINVPIANKFRRTNFFYINNNNRLRIDFKNTIYHTPNKEFSWTLNEMEQEINNNPEKFSPNVLMRPLYQETILPNLGYIGGAAEYTYWLLLTKMFEKSNIVFPILSIRKTKIYISQRVFSKINNQTFDSKNPFKTPEDINQNVNNYIFGTNIFETISKDLKINIQEYLMELGKERNKLTKKFKDIMDNTILHISELSAQNTRNMQENNSKNEQNTALINAHSAYFNQKMPWERNFFLLEVYLLISNSKTLFINDLEPHNLSINTY